MTSYKDIDLTKHSNKKYKLTNNEIIGKGAFSQVYLCDSTYGENKQNYVVKVQLSKEREYALNELNILNKVKKHNKEYQKQYKNKYNIESNLVKNYDYFISDDYIYIIYEKCNINLEEFNIAYLKKYKSQLPLFIIEYIIYSICNGINELNFNNIIHCDIKLDNILIKFNNVQIKNKKKDKIKNINNINDLFQLINDKTINNYEETILNAFDIKIIDFNKSCFINQIYKSCSVQTIYFQAPEIVFGNRNYNESIDSWSIGCIIWWLLTSEILFDIYNHNLEYGKLYENYNSDIEDSESDKSSVGYTTSNSGSYSYGTDMLENYIYLLKVKSLIGECNNELLIGEKINDYMYNNKILCNNIELKKSDIINYLLSKIDNFKYNNEEEKKLLIKKITNLYVNILKQIFTYDYNNRIKCKEIITYL